MRVESDALIRRARKSPTGWLLAFIAFGVLGAGVGLVVAWASGWPSSVTLALGAAIGLLLAWRGVARPPEPLGVATPDTDLSRCVGPRVRLRRFTEVDARADAVLDTIDDEVTSSMGWSTAEIATITSTARNSHQLQSQGFLAISSSGSDRAASDLGTGDAGDGSSEVDLLGVVSLTRPTETPGVAWLGLWLAPSARGLGLATEAIGLAAQLARSAGLRSITMGTTNSNEAMKRSFLAAGAELFDTTEHLLPDGRTVESVWFRLDGPTAP